MGNQDEIERRIKNFKEDLPNLPPLSVFHKYIDFGECYAMNSNDHTHLREQVEEKFGIDARHVIVVGSAKLGFSIAPNKMYRHFNEKSDIDLAIVSSDLFEKIWKDVFDYWSNGGKVDHEAWPNRKRQYFFECLFRGWLRPDQFPSAAKFSFNREWISFFEQQLPSLGSYGATKISAGVYKSLHYLHSYHCQSIDVCRQNLEMELLAPLQEEE